VLYCKNRFIYVNVLSFIAEDPDVAALLGRQTIPVIFQAQFASDDTQVSQLLKLLQHEKSTFVQVLVVMFKQLYVSAHH
jgi:hypothetical protein